MGMDIAWFKDPAENILALMQGENSVKKGKTNFLGQNSYYFI